MIITITRVSKARIGVDVAGSAPAALNVLVSNCRRPIIAYLLRAITCDIAPEDAVGQRYATRPITGDSTSEVVSPVTTEGAVSNRRPAVVAIYPTTLVVSPVTTESAVSNRRAVARGVYPTTITVIGIGASRVAADYAIGDCWARTVATNCSTLGEPHIRRRRNIF